MAGAMEGEFDYIIVGAGSAGCILANRLSADPAKRVLILEAGGRDNWIWFHIPVGYLFAIGNPRSDWLFKTEPEEGLNGRSLNYPRGKVIGGSSSINAMIYMRGQAADFDHWRQLGLNGWGWDDVLPFFRKHENHFMGESDAHAVGGEWHVSAPRVRWDLLDAFHTAAEQAGIKSISDFNCGDNEGICTFHVNQKRGRRWSAASAFLKPVLNRQNLRLETGCLVEGIVFDGKRAAGVRWSQVGETRTAKCRGEVILAAGSIGSTQLLLLSGVGPAQQLQEHGIPILLDRPGVGNNLQDHLQLRMIYKGRRHHDAERALSRAVRHDADAGRICVVSAWTLDHGAVATWCVYPLRSGSGARQFAVPRATAVARSFRRTAAHLSRLHGERHQCAANVRPTSRGYVRLRSRNPADKPVIKPNYLSTDEDRRIAASSIRLTRRIVGQPALKGFHPKEYLPGPTIEDDEQSLIRAAGDIGTTIFHPVGTAKMGLPSDPMMVVDDRLRVFGLERLRVVDASVMPSITSGNTNAPTMMIAERGASLIREDAKTL